MDTVFTSYVESKTGLIVTAALIGKPLPSLEGIKTAWDEEGEKYRPEPSAVVGDVLLTYADSSRRIVDTYTLEHGFLPGGAGTGGVWSPEFRTPDGNLCFIATQRWMCCCEAAAILLGSKWAHVPGDSFLFFPGGPQPTGRAVDLEWLESGQMRIASTGARVTAAVWNSGGGGLRLGLLPDETPPPAVSVDAAEDRRAA